MKLSLQLRKPCASGIVPKQAVKCFYFFSFFLYLRKYASDRICCPTRIVSKKIKIVYLNYTCHDETWDMVSPGCSLSFFCRKKFYRWFLLQQSWVLNPMTTNKTNKTFNNAMFPLIMEKS